MSTLLLLTNTLQPSTQLMPALSLLSYTVRVLPAEPAALLAAPPADAVLLDATTDLGAARSLCRLLRTTGLTVPLILVVGEGGMAVVSSDWGMDDVVLAGAQPAELAARLRLSAGRLSTGAQDEGARVIRSGDVLVDDAAYTARAGGRSLDLTFKEFELLKFLAQHPGRVFSRQQLLQEVWGYDYFGGTRTVDVHVRRLRAKLGPEYEARIGTVRNVGYRFLAPTTDGSTPPHTSEDEAASTSAAR
jgi:DNA-binding response OmpR family regulator